MQSFIRRLPQSFFTRGVVNQLFVSDREKPFKSQDVKQFALNVGDAWKVKLPQYQGGEDFLNRVVRCTKGSLKKIPGVAKTDSWRTTKSSLKLEVL